MGALKLESYIIAGLTLQENVFSFHGGELVALGFIKNNTQENLQISCSNTDMSEDIGMITSL